MSNLRARDYWEAQLKLWLEHLREGLQITEWRCAAATDIAKMAADIVMLDKDLATICEGVIIGRRTSGNTIKCACCSHTRLYCFLQRRRSLSADRDDTSMVLLPGELCGVRRVGSQLSAISERARNPWMFFGIA